GVALRRTVDGPSRQRATSMLAAPVRHLGLTGADVVAVLSPPRMLCAATGFGATLAVLEQQYSFPCHIDAVAAGRRPADITAEASIGPLWGEAAVAVLARPRLDGSAPG